MILTKEEFRKENIKYLAEHWTEEILPEDAADVFGYSVRYYSAKFKECFGIPFQQYFTKLKLHRVAKEIADTNSLRNMYYVGKRAEKETPPQDNQIRMELPEDYYAVISVEIPSDAGTKGLSAAAKELTQYVFGEWYLSNKKATKKMGIIYEVYIKNRAAIYVPMYQRKRSPYEKKLKLKGAEAWIQYIDENMLQGLTVTALAEHFHYSERHFTDTFEMYYGIRPGRYMKKRKLYLAASELNSGEEDIDSIAAKYGFASRSLFENEFSEEFRCMPQDYNGDVYKAENLRQYYEVYKHSILVSVVELQDMYIAGEDVQKRTSYYNDSENLLEAIVCLMRDEQFDHLECTISDIKTEIWQTVRGESGRNLSNSISMLL